MSGSRLRIATVVIALLAIGIGGIAIGASGADTEPLARKSQTSLPGFSRAVFLGHVNNPAQTPGFPGDPAFEMDTVFTVKEDGFALQYVKEGEHTGTHYSAPCHFHRNAACANQMSPGDFVLPLVVVDVRKEVRDDVDYEIRIADLKDWKSKHGPLPDEAAVVGFTGCSRFWGPRRGPGIPSYYNCGTGKAGFHQPGFSAKAVRWLIERGVLGFRGALGTDTFGPDPGTDFKFRESALTLRRHRMTLENLANLSAVPESGAWIVIGGPRNRRGTGAQGSIIALVP